MDSLSKDLMADLADIRASVGGLTVTGLPWKTRDPVDLIDQGNRMLHCFESWLLDDEQKQMLSMQPLNIYILYASAYLCDIGLTDSAGRPSVAQDLKDSQVAASFIQSFCTRSYKLIRANWQDLGIIDANLADIIARVCLEAGNDKCENFPVAESKAATIAGETVNVALLAACLRLSKALDPKSTATMLHLYTHLPMKDRFSLDRLDEYFTFLDAGQHPYLNGMIRLRFRCTHPEIHRALKHHERTVQHLLECLNQSVRPRFLYSEVIYEIQPEGYTPIDLKFSVDSSAGLQLFMGNRLYTDKRVFLRELIQNAVDACNYRKLFDDTYSPAVAIEFNDDISVIRIQDNGIGMTRQWIEKYFLAIGISFYQSTEIRNINRDSRIDFGFISQFGIGFLSSFLVAEKIVIKTRKISFPGLMITITGLRDYFDVRVLEENYPIGTEVILHLKKSKIKYCRSLEFVGYLKTNIRFLKVPVILKDEGGNSITIGGEQLAYDTNKDAGTVFVAPLNFLDSEGYVRLGAKKNGANIHALESASGGVSMFQDGIFVTQVASLLPEGARQHVVTRINLMGKDKCELSMDRNRMFWTAAQLQNIKKIIRYGLVDVANQLITAVQAQHVSVDIQNSIVNHLAIFFDFSDVDDVMYHQLCEPIRRVVEKRFRDFVRINFAHTLKAAGFSESDGYCENWQQKVFESFAKL